MLLVIAAKNGSAISGMARPTAASAPARKLRASRFGT